MLNVNPVAQIEGIFGVPTNTILTKLVATFVPTVIDTEKEKGFLILPPDGRLVPDLPPVQEHRLHPLQGVHRPTHRQAQDGSVG